MKHLYSLVFALIALTSLNFVTAQNIIPNVTYTNDNTFSCSGTASAAPTGGTGSYSYMWSTGETTSSINGLCAGSYSVFIQDANQDTAYFNFTITNPCSNISLSATATNCTPGNCDGTIQATVTGGSAPYTFSVSGGAQMAQSLISNLCPGTYTITVMDANGCSAVATATVTDPSAQTPIIPNLTSTDDLNGSCSGSASVSPTGGSGSYSYIWSSGQTTPSITNLCAGTYTVLITDSNQDTISASCVITNPCSNFTGIINTVAASGPAICNGSIMFNPFNGTAPYIYTWSNGTTTQTISNACPGNYTVTCTDSIGCVVTSTGTVWDSSTTPTPLLVNLSTTDDLSNDCSGSAAVAPSGSSGVYFVEWSTGQTTNSINNLCPGIYSVLVWSTAYSDSTFISFIIADSSSTYGNNPYPNGSINDTLYTDLVTNCIIDYNTIDSASLYQAVYDSINQNLYVTWAIYSPTDTVYISDTLGWAGLSGYYALTISVYCPNKSGNDFMKINGVIYYDGTNIWTSTLTVNEHLLDKVSVYPNPFTSFISIDNKDGMIRSAKLIDLNGRILSEMDQTTSGLVKLDQLESISSGTYLLILSGENTSKTFKVIK